MAAFTATTIMEPYLPHPRDFPRLDADGRVASLGAAGYPCLSPALHWAFRLLRRMGRAPGDLGANAWVVTSTRQYLYPSAILRRARRARSEAAEAP
jgi:hypothetical protein